MQEFDMDPAIYAKVSAMDATLPITHTKTNELNKLQKQCKCGNIIHVAKNWCEKCGRQKTPSTIDWQSLKRKALVCETLATKHVFNTICELNAAHHHDVLVFIHNKDEREDKFRVWGTPGDAQQLLEDANLGDAMREAWKANFKIGGSIKKPAGHAPDKRRRIETGMKQIQKSSDENDDESGELSSTSSSAASLPYMHRKAAKDDDEKTSQSESTSDEDEDPKYDGTITLSSASSCESPRPQPSEAAEEDPKDDESSTSFCSSSVTHSAHQKPNYFITDPDVYEVEKIVASKMCKKDHVIKYLIKWQGYPKSVNTWEPEENIIDKSLLERYRNSRN